MPSVLLLVVLWCLLALPPPGDSQVFQSWRVRSHATDCTQLTDGQPADLCKELDSFRLFLCEPDAGNCSGTEWKEVVFTITEPVLPAVMTRDTEWNTEAALEAALGSVNLLLATELDTSLKLFSLLATKTGTGLAVFGTSPTLTSPTVQTSFTLLGDDLGLTFQPLTANDSSWWITPNHDSGGDDDDVLEFRQSATPGSQVRATLAPDGTFNLPASATVGGSLTLGEKSTVGADLWALEVDDTDLPPGTTRCKLNSAGRLPDSCIGDGVDSAEPTPGPLANAPACTGANKGQLYIVTDALTLSDCTQGGGVENNDCYCDGAGSYADSESLAAPDLAAVLAQGRIDSSATGFASRVQMGDGTNRWSFWCDGAGVCHRALCPANAVSKADCLTTHLEAINAPLTFRNTSGDACFSIDHITGAFTPITTGTCATNLVSGDCAPFEVLRRNAADTAWECVPSSSGRVVTPPTDTHTMVASDCGTMLTNADGDPLTINLLADPTNGGKGCSLCVFAETAQTITIDPNGTDSVLVNGLTPAAGDAIQLAAVLGNNLCLVGKSTTLWLVFLGTGVVIDLTP